MLDPNRMWLAIGVVAALALAAAWLRQPANDPSAGPTAVTTVKDGDKVRTELMTREQCLAKPARLWAALDEGAECIAYVAPESGIRGDTAILFFEGDIGDRNMLPERASKMVAGYRQLATDGQLRFGIPLVVMARPGVLGSTGEHLFGGRRDEGEVVNVAVDAFKERYGVRRLVLAGQSGGARLIAQLLVLGRRDILCGVMGSGAYGLPATKGGKVPTNIFGEPSRRYLVPMRQAQGIQYSGERRLFVIGDTRDKRTPFDGQREWAEQLRGLGHHAVLHEAAGRGPEYHGMSTVSLQVAGLCATGKSDAEIAAFVASKK